MVKLKTQFEPIANMKHLIIFKGKTQQEGEVIKGLTVNLFSLLVSFYKAETNWRNVKTDKDIKFRVRLRKKTLNITSYKLAVDIGFHK